MTAGPDGASAPAAPPALSRDTVRQTVLAERGRIWKDPRSITDARIGEPFTCRRNLMTTRFDKLADPATCVCVEANARNAFGGYTGLRHTIVRFLGDGELEPLTAEELGFERECRALLPFPELNGPK